MRALPQYLLDWLPSRALVADRPWWSQHGHLVRIDGLRISRISSWHLPDAWRIPGVPCYYNRAEWSAADPKTAYVPTMEAAILRADREAPMAHPGLRPGQIWALEYTHYLEPGEVEPQVSYVCATLSFGAFRRHGWVLGNDAVSEDDLAGRRAGCVPFLLHDPLLPNKAPWAPPEVPHVG